MEEKKLSGAPVPYEIYTQSTPIPVLAMDEEPSVQSTHFKTAKAPKLDSGGGGACVVRHRMREERLQREILAWVTDGVAQARQALVQASAAADLA